MQRIFTYPYAARILESDAARIIDDKATWSDRTFDNVVGAANYLLGRYRTSLSTRIYDRIYGLLGLLESLEYTATDVKKQQVGIAIDYAISKDVLFLECYYKLSRIYAPIELRSKRQLLRMLQEILKLTGSDLASGQVIVECYHDLIQIYGPADRGPKHQILQMLEEIFTRSGSETVIESLAGDIRTDYFNSKSGRFGQRLRYLPFKRQIDHQSWQTNKIGEALSEHSYIPTLSDGWRGSLRVSIATSDHDQSILSDTSSLYQTAQKTAEAETYTFGMYLRQKADGDADLVGEEADHGQFGCLFHDLGCKRDFNTFLEWSDHIKIDHSLGCGPPIVRCPFPCHQIWSSSQERRQVPWSQLCDHIIAEHPMGGICTIRNDWSLLHYLWLKGDIDTRFFHMLFAAPWLNNSTR